MKLVVPYAAGGGTDAIARLVAQGVGEKLGQSLIVENNGSAGGNVATQQAAKAEPDGYTVLMANQGPMVVNPHLFKNVKIDPLTAFDPLTLITAAPLVVVVPKNSPHKTIKELIEHAQKNPGKLTYGSAGNGSASHLATVLLAQEANFQATHVPYRGAGPALNDLLGGRMDFMVTTVPSVLGLIESGGRESPCGHVQGPGQEVPGGALRGGKRMAGLRGDGLVWVRRSEGYAEGHRRQDPEGDGRDHHDRCRAGEA